MRGLFIFLSFIFLSAEVLAQQDSLSKWSYLASLQLHRFPRIPAIEPKYGGEGDVASISKPLNFNFGFDFNWKFGKRRRWEILLSNSVIFSKTYINQSKWEDDKVSGVYTQSWKSGEALFGYSGVRYIFPIGNRLEVSPSIVFPLYLIGVVYRPEYEMEITNLSTGEKKFLSGFSEGSGNNQNPSKIVGGFFGITSLTPRLDVAYKLNQNFALNLFAMPSTTRYHYPDRTEVKIGLYVISLGLKYSPSLH